MSSFRICVLVAAMAATGGAACVPRAAQLASPVVIRGLVAGSVFTPASGATPSTTTAAYYGNAKVCVDASDNGVCDADEVVAVTSSAGAFTLTSPRVGPVVAEIPVGATSSAGPVVSRLTLRASADQVIEDVAAGRGPSGAGPGAAGSASAAIAITPLSTEVVRMMEADRLGYQAAKLALARRVNVPASRVLADPGTISEPGVRTALLAEAFILSRRFVLAAKMVDRGEASPDAGAAGARRTMTMKEAQQAAMNLEGIPRYDHVFIIVLENKATSRIKNSPLAPKINAYLTAGNQFTSYYSTGNPSLPNRLAISSGDDFGITDDSAWNCVPAGDTANLPEEPLPAGRMPCTNTTNHNLKHKANLFTALTQAGLSWRMYNESMNPGRDWRLNSAADATLVAADHVYPASSPVGQIGHAQLRLPMPSQLYATKHNATVMFQDVRASPEFAANNRTLGGGQWDEAIRLSPSTPKGWNIDQFGADLLSGDVGAVNMLEPDQCDDMHGLNVNGTVAGTDAPGVASDCSGDAVIFRGDNYVDYLIRKIQASPVWTNQAKRVAIVIMFDEASATTGFNACCGWNPSAGASVAGASLGVLGPDAAGRATVDTTIARYNQGNKGHGSSVFGVLTNQPGAPKGVVDSDAYSHVSFVRTLQDMFQLADPADDWSYMNRSKYTEAFIATHLSLLPEYASSADPHFDAVRPMNHAYVIPQGYVQKNGFPVAQVGPDRNQLNAWAIK